MSSYKLYGTKLIKNDSTLDCFAMSVFEGVPVDWSTIKSDDEEHRDEICYLVWQILDEDISRTDISYEELLKKYACSMGMLLYQIENHGYPVPEIHFFGNDAMKYFNELIYRYIELNYSLLVKCMIP